MTGPEHYAEAERLAESVKDRDMLAGAVTAVATLAQVHATLANTAAVIASGISVIKPSELGEWRKAMDPGYAAEVTP